MAAGDEDSVNALLRHRGVNAVSELVKPDTSGSEPIHLATEFCSRELVENLLGRGVDPKERRVTA